MNPIVLPGIDSVKRGISPRLIWMLLICIPTIIIGISALRLKDPIGLIADFLVFMLIPIGLPIIIGVLIGYKYSQYKTDITGLTILGLFGSIHIRWSDVTSAKTLQNDDVEFSTTTGQRVIRLCDPYILASTLQNLRRYLPEDVLKFGESVQSFFVPIPDDFPEEIVWENPNSIRMWPTYTRQGILTILLVAMIIDWVIRHSTLGMMLWYMPFYILLFINLFVADARFIARRVTVKADQLIIEVTRKSYVINWDRVQSIMCGKRGINIISREGTILIPYFSNDATQHQVLQAMSYRLRARVKPMLVLGECES